MPDADQLGGRLALLPVDRLTDEQRRVHDRMIQTRIRRGTQAGYRASLADGRLIGPFNALLRVPGIATAQLDWVQAISVAGPPADVREVAILTVAAHWPPGYVSYAHTIAARAAGVDHLAVQTLAAGETPDSLTRPQSLAHRLAHRLVERQDVPDELYQPLVECFGEAGTVALVLLIGQYLVTSALLTCFRVPAPVD